MAKQYDNIAADVEKFPLDEANDGMGHGKGITPFQQAPAEKDTERTLDRIGPDELFSLFTAHIIKKNMVFVR